MSVVSEPLMVEQVTSIIESSLERHGVNLATVEGTRDDAEAILSRLQARPDASEAQVTINIEGPITIPPEGGSILIPLPNQRRLYRLQTR